MGIFYTAPVRRVRWQWSGGVATLVLVASGVNGQTLDEVVVTGAYQRDGVSSSKLAVPLMELPLSQQSVTRELIDERGVQRLDEAIDSVAGVRRVNGYPGASGYYVRGFFEGNDLLRDGFRDINYGATDLIGLERIDVLKGPAAVLYSGNLSAGGVINLVAREPQRAGFTDVHAAGGSFGFWRASVDSAGALNQDESILYRLGAAVEDSGDFRDHIDSDQWAVAPSLRWNPTDRDTVLLKAEYVKAQFSFPADFPMNEAVLDLPVERYLLEPGLGGSSSENRRVTLDYQHRFSDAWKVRLAGNVARFDIDIGNDRLFYPALNPDGHTMPRPVSAGPQETDNDEFQLEAYGTFDIGPTKHTLVIGSSAFEQTYETRNYYSDLGEIDIFAPVYGAQPVFSFSGGYESSVKSAGVFAQDLITVSKQVKVLAAVRRDRMKSMTGDPLAGTRTHATDDATTYRAGVVYQPLARTSLYASTATSFVPNIFYRSIAGNILEPTSGRQWELGIKQEWLDRQQLSTSIALFEIKRRDIPTPDIDNPGFSVSRGEQRSRGLEFELVGQLTPAWRINASYAYIDAEVTADAALPVGDRLAGVPKNSLSLWSRYEIQGGSLQGLGLGLGAYYAAAVEATLPNTFELDAYTRWDALLYYEVGEGLRVSLNAKNLTDERYYDTDGAYTLRPNAPRAVIASVDKRF